MLFLSCSCVTALHPTSGFAVRFNAWQEAYRPQTDDVSNSVGPTPSGTLSCAVCVVGQLARLELESKVRHTLALAHISQALARARARALALALALRNPSHNPNTTKFLHVVTLCLGLVCLYCIAP